MALRICGGSTDQRQGDRAAATLCDGVGMRINGTHDHQSDGDRAAAAPPSFAFIGYIAYPQCLAQSPTSRPVRTTAYFTLVRRHIAVILRLFALA